MANKRGTELTYKWPSQWGQVKDGIAYTVIVKFDEDPEYSTIEIEHGHNRGIWFNLELDDDPLSQIEEMIDIAIEFEDEEQAAA